VNPKRAEAQAVLDELSAEYVGRPGISRSPMFGSVGLRLNGRFFAFIGREGVLVVKLPADLARPLVASGQAAAVRVGRNPTREWVGLSMPSDGRSDEWAGHLAAAYQHAKSETGADV
jgi:hypothetical protein